MNFSSFFSSPDAIKTFNKVINSTSQQLLCGPGSQCAKDKESSNLEKKYRDSQNNMNTASQQLFDSEKNYYLYSKGQAGYNQFLNEKYTSEANKVVKDLTNNFNIEVHKVMQMNNTLKSLAVNYENEKELNQDYSKKNERLRDKIVDHDSDIITNDRKTHYEKENYDRLVGWNKFWFWIYIIFLLIFAVSLFVNASRFSLIQKLLILGFFAIYPFVINPIVFFIIRVIANLLTYIPKNAYLNV